MIILVILACLVFFLVSLAIKICGENERIVIFRLGRKLNVSDPGLIIVIPIFDKVVKIKVGDRATVLTADLIALKNTEFPWTAGADIPIGTMVRIIGFIGKGANNSARIAVVAE